MKVEAIKVLVVDDSDTSRSTLVHVLESDPDIRIIGAVNSGREAIDFVETQTPDVVLMDIHMPGLDGFETTRLIMETRPVPIIICSATTDVKEVALTFRVMEAGAVAFVEKPRRIGHPEFEASAESLRQMVKLMSEVKVVRRTMRSRHFPSVPRPSIQDESRMEGIRIIGIGSSTGGPTVLQTILAGLPKDFPAPILIVQHITPGFLPGMIEWLSQTTGFQIHVAANGIRPLPGHVYLAPDDFHMALGFNGSILLTKEAPENGVRPSVASLFRSLAEARGMEAVGVLLTGMGKDGAEALKQMRDQGAVTIAQDRESSLIHGMAGTAIALGGASFILPPEKISRKLSEIVTRPRSKVGEPT